MAVAMRVYGEVSMLFVLTGDVQTGKTRWLEAVLEELREAGVTIAGVLAPGIWRERSEAEMEELRLAGEEPSRFEKLGIDNVLLPQGERLLFARRRDLAEAEGSFEAKSQSAQAKLQWEMPEEALERVNAHLAALADVALDKTSLEDAAPAAFLVIDEVGRLELLRNGGLTAALDLLDAGPNPAYRHTLIIVREELLEIACERFEPAWGSPVSVSPDEEGRALLLGAFSV